MIGMRNGLVFGLRMCLELQVDGDISREDLHATLTAKSCVEIRRSVCGEPIVTESQR